MKLLVASGTRLYLVDPRRRSVEVLKETDSNLYGVSWFADGQELCHGNHGPRIHPRGLDEHIHSEHGWVTVGERRSAGILASPHQLVCADDLVIATNTGRNCLTLFRRDDLFYRHHWLDDVRWDRLGTEYSCGSHFNSVVVRGDRLYVLAHNFDRGSYMLELTWPGLQPVRHVPIAAKWAHNLWVRADGSILTCDSRHCRLVEVFSGETVWHGDDAQAIPRGLAVREGTVFIGMSAFLDPDFRPDSSGGIWVVDEADWKTREFIELPASGPVYEIRVVEGDECHHGAPLRCPLIPDEAATAAYHAAARGRSKPEAHALLGTGPCTSLPFQADWPNADHEPLEAPWAVAFGQMRAIHGALRTSLKSLSLAYLEGVVERDVCVSAHLDVSHASTRYVGLLARYQGPGDTGGYLGMLNHQHPNVSVDLWKNVGGGWELLATAPVAQQAGVLSLQVRGSTLCLFFEGELYLRVEDDDITGAGSVGIRSFGGRVRDFRAARHATAAATSYPPVPLHHATMVKRPLRVGLGYGIQNGLAPEGGIGAYLHAIAGALLKSPEPIEIVAVVCPGEHGVPKNLASIAPERFKVIDEDALRPGGWRQLSRWLCRWRSAADRVTATMTRWRQIPTQLGTWLWTGFRGAVTGFRERDWRGAMALFGLTLSTPFCWASLIVYYVLTGLLYGVAVPLTACDALVRWLSRPAGKISRLLRKELIEAAACDVWILPCVDLPPRRGFPAIVYLRDLINTHLPEIFRGAFFAHLDQCTADRAGAAVLLVCKPKQMLEQNLLEIIKIPHDETQLPSVDATGVGCVLNTGPEASRPYIFCPVPFNDNDNHRLLILALHELQKYPDGDQWDLMFVGGKSSVLPPELDTIARRHGVRTQVKVVAHADAQQLESCARNAFAVVVPTPPTKGSDAVRIALAAGVPVACADYPAWRTQCAPLGDAMLYFSPKEPRALAQLLLDLQGDRPGIIARQQVAANSLWGDTWSNIAGDLRGVLYGSAQSVGHAALTPIVEALAPSAATGPYRVFLMLPWHYTGGVWQAARNLVHALSAINRQRGQLEITLGLEPALAAAAANEFGPDVRVCEVKLAQEILSEGPSARLCFTVGGATAADAEAWVALADRFETPLRTDRPYGVFVHDMIQRHAPEAFTDQFFHHQAEGMGPTLRGAARVFTTSPATWCDVRDEFGIAEENLRLLPVACEAATRFGRLRSEPVSLPRSSFILDVTNTSPHKGAEHLFRAYRRLKDTLGPECPLLVLCGHGTEHFSARVHDQGRIAEYWTGRRAPLIELGLEEGNDVVFLGLVSDAELKDLYERCAVVVNAARFDNGSFSLIEARYFGKPTVSTDYPACRFLTDRFSIPTHFAPIGDDEALAEALRSALREPPVDGFELENVRRDLEAPELRYERVAEEVYRTLLELAAQGRCRAERLLAA
jgi:glycosyltransferase involved in cell wall biosynthesis